MILKACRRCGRLVAYPASHCPECARVVADERRQAAQAARSRANAAYNARRDPKYTRFYASKAWRELRRARMEAASWECTHPGCERTAVECHHDPPISTPEGWAHRLDWDHLHPLCLEHHNEAHGRFLGSDARRSR